MIDMAKGYELSDSEWERISDFFPVSKTGYPPKWDNNVSCNYVACPQRFCIGGYPKSLSSSPATRYDKLASFFFAFIPIVAIAILLK